MLNMNQFLGNAVADNTVVINGATFKVTDDVATKILNLCLGRDIEVCSQSEQKAAVQVQTKSDKDVKTAKTPYVATKEFKPVYEIKEQTATDGTKLFCISRKNGWTKAEKKLMNDAIKALKGIKTIDVSYEKDGKTRTFKAWGYNTESTAKKHFKELPTVFTVEQLNNAL